MSLKDNRHPAAIGSTRLSRVRLHEWDYKANGDRTPENTSYSSGYQAHWRKWITDPVTGKLIEKKWVTAVYNRTYPLLKNNR